MATKSLAAKTTKLAYFVRVPDPSGVLSFFNASDFIGKVMPFDKPQATCAMQVKDDTIAFSLLHLSKRTSVTIASEPIEIPRGPLARLDRRAANYSDLPINHLVADFDGGIYHFDVVVDDAGAARLELSSVEGREGIGPDVETFELPKGAVHMDLYIRSPKVPRTLAIGFIGHLGRPGEPDTVTRSAAKILNSLSYLLEFRLLTGLETVTVPAGPSKWSVRSTALRQVERDVATEVPVWLFSEPAAEAPVLLASGAVVVTVDLENANPASGHLLCHYTPSASVIDVFENYRSVFDLKVAEYLRTALGSEDIASMAIDIVLGSVDDVMAERLSEALETIRPLDLTVTQVREHATV